MAKKYIRYSHNHRGFQIFIIIYLILCTLFCLLSLFITLLNACKTNANIVSNGIFGLLEGNVFQIIGENFKMAWSTLRKSFWNSILFSLVGSFLNCLIGAILAYVFTYKEFPFKNFIFTVYISVMLLPSIMGMPILVPFMQQKLQWANTIYGYLSPMIAGGQVASLFLFKTFFAQQPLSIYESAKVEGGNDFMMFIRITIPLALPIMLYHFIGSFSSIYNDYLWASLIMEPGTLMMPTLQSASQNFQDAQRGAMYMLYVISSFPLIITTAVSMKFFASGEFASGLKL
ncbi:MAG: carbohydrate ABC transporter permease [Bacilli bacterium]|nr:carbohydrate ABC transporter permease [Bacilli bacterium]